jgi:DNA-directed RNA polymerase specialized sigma24 family protein
MADRYDDIYVNNNRWVPSKRRYLGFNEDGPKPKSTMDLDTLQRNAATICASMPIDHVFVFKLRYEEVLSYREIAQKLNIPEPLARKRVQQMRECVTQFLSTKAK